MADITSNMICRYKCDENTGSFYLNSVEDGHHLFIVSGGWTTGLVGLYCLNNTATSQYATTTTWSGIQGTGAFSFAFWFKTSASGNQSIISFGHSSNAGQAYRARIESGVFWLRCNSATASGGSSLNSGSWHHVVITQPASATMDQAKIYIDGSVITPTVTGPTQALNRGTTADVYCGYDFIDGSWYVGQKDDLRIYQRELAAADVTELYNLTEPTEFSNYRVWNHVVDTSARTLQFNGSFTGTTPSSIEIQLADASDTNDIIQDWAALFSLSTDGNTWSGLLSVNDGPFLKMRARKKDGGGTVLSTSPWSTNKFGVGMLILLAGQSNAAHMADWYTNLSPTSNTQTALYDASITTWSAPWSDGSIILTDLIQQELGYVVGIVNCAQGGTGLFQSVGSGYWLDFGTPGSPYDDFFTALAAVGGDIELILWHQGEADCIGGTSYSDYYDSLDSLFAHMLSDIERDTTEISFGIGSLATLNDGSTDTNTNNIRSAQVDWAYNNAAANVFYLGSNIDATRIDNYHYNATSYQHIARRWAQSILHHWDLATTSGEGPYIESVNRHPGSNIIRVVINLNGATQIQEGDGTTDGVGLTGWQVSTNDFASTLTISSTSFYAGRVYLTLSTTPANNATVKVRYQYGAVPTITKPVYSDILPQSDTLGLPLQSSRSTLTVALKPGQMLTNKTGHHVISTS